MIRRLTEDDREGTIDFLNRDFEANLFILGDIYNFGFETDFQRLWGDFGFTGELRAVLLQYFRSLVFCSREGYDLNGMLQLAGSLDCSMLSGALDSVAPFQRLGCFKPLRKLHLCRLMQLLPQSSPEQEAAVIRLSPADAGRISKLRGLIREFGAGVTAEEIRHGMEKESGRSYGIEQNGELVAIATSTAENPLSAMIVGVCTDPRYRQRGFASLCMSKLCRELLSEGRTPCLFYDNPHAGTIYTRLGFEDVGLYGILERAR